MVSWNENSQAAIRLDMTIELSRYGIVDVSEIVYNPSYEQLFEEEVRYDLTGLERGVLTDSGAVAVDTGKFTGRSPLDKYIVKDELTRDILWWADQGVNDNKPISEELWAELKNKVSSHLDGKRLFVVDAYCGANENSRLSVRFVTEVAWQAHFVTNMFIRPPSEELAGYDPDFVVLNGASMVNDQWQEHGMNSENFVAFNFSEKMQLIAGTWYAGEMKKGLFSYMNFLLPLQGIASMHCSANAGEDGSSAVFFGLSGTGKTTLSIDPKRHLIGDDEHGWDDDGVFNFEGGCYAKTIRLSAETEPDVYGAIRRDALLENVVVREDGSVDYDDASKTENARVSYPIHHIENIVKPVSRAGHATKVIFLSADAFGVLPAVSLLTPEQARYHFLSGFTAKLAGTELGITSPQPTFSACFGKAFLSLHPTKYADDLGKRMAASGAKAYLVNTGWNGTGERISIKVTRAIIDAILNGSIENSETALVPTFDLRVPISLPGVGPHLLDPRNTYENTSVWQSKANKLAQLFIENFEQYTDTDIGRVLVDAGPMLIDEQVEKGSADRSLKNDDFVRADTWRQVIEATSQRNSEDLLPLAKVWARTFPARPTLLAEAMIGSDLSSGGEGTPPDPNNSTEVYWRSLISGDGEIEESGIPAAEDEATAEAYTDAVESAMKLREARRGLAGDDDQTLRRTTTTQGDGTFSTPGSPNSSTHSPTLLGLPWYEALFVALVSSAIIYLGGRML